MNEIDILYTMKNLFNGIDEVRKNLTAKLYEKDGEQEDLLHELELSKLNASEMTQIMKRLKAVRLERRDLKNELEKANTLKGFTDKYNNKFIIKDISQLISNLETLESNQKTRKYNPRILKDLKVGGTKL